MFNEATDSAGLFKGLTSEFFADPYPTYRRLRETEPVFWCEPLGRWLISRYEDVSAALRDPQRFASGNVELVAPSGAEEELASFLRLSERWLFFIDPPQHSQGRKSLSALFTPQAVEVWRPLARTLAQELLEARRPEGDMDVLEDFALPLTAGVLADLIRIPAPLRAAFLSWSLDILRRDLACGQGETPARASQHE